MIDELCLAFEQARERPEDVQRQIAALVRETLERAQRDAERPSEPRASYAGAWSDLPEDDEVAALDRMRHEVPPTPPMDEQLRWLDEG